MKQGLMVLALAMFAAAPAFAGEGGRCGKGFSGTKAYAFSYDSGQSIIGFTDGYSSCDSASLQKSASITGKTACGKTGKGKGYAMISWYSNGEYVRGQKYDCGDL